MAYTPINWDENTLVTAVRLDNMEIVEFFKNLLNSNYKSEKNDNGGTNYEVKVKSYLEEVK